MRGAVLGHPIGHSKSPALHRAANALLGLDYDYEAIDVEVPGLAELLARVRSGGDWYGLSVTMPLKNAMTGHCDELTETAGILGAVNTVVITRTDDGGTHLRGDNTDVAGIANALLHAGARTAPAAAVLGGGGTAVSALAALTRLQAPAVDVFVRDVVKAGPLHQVADALGMELRLRPWEAAAGALAAFDVVVSTLPPRAADPLAAALLEVIPAGAGSGKADPAGAGSGDIGRPGTGPFAGAHLLDVAYDPWPSALAHAWSAGGGTIVPGIEMLLYQGVEQVKMFAAAGGHGDRAAGNEHALLNVMCDAIGLPRR